MKSNGSKIAVDNISILNTFNEKLSLKVFLR